MPRFFVSTCLFFLMISSVSAADIKGVSIGDDLLSAEFDFEHQEIYRDKENLKFILPKGGEYKVNAGNETGKVYSIALKQLRIQPVDATHALNLAAGVS